MNSEFLKKLELQWRTLSDRDRFLLSIAVISLSTFLLYAILWMPMQKRVKQLRINLPAAQQKLSLMQVQATQIKRLKSRRPEGQVTGSPLTVMEKTASIRGLRQNMTKLEPDGSDGIRVNFEEIHFDALLLLLSDLRQKNGLKVHSATVDRYPDSPGLVNSQLTLRRTRP